MPTTGKKRGRPSKAEIEARKKRTDGYSQRLEYPWREPDEGLRPTRHIEFMMTLDQAHKLRGLFEGLVRDNKRLENQRAVSTTADAARWLIEQIDSNGNPQ